MPGRCSSGTMNWPSSASLAAGLIRRSTAATSARPCPRRTRWRNDSGSRKASTAARTSGRTPPTMNTEGQPYCVTSQAASSPPSVAPMRKAREHHHGGEGALAGREILRRHGDGVRHRAAEAEPGQEPQHDQRIERAREGGEDGHRAEQDRAQDQNPLAADPVRERRDRQAADQEAEEPEGEDGSELGGCDLQVAHHGGGHITDHLRIESIERRGQAHQCRHQDLGAADRLCLDPGRNVDARRHGGSFPVPGRAPAPGTAGWCLATAGRCPFPKASGTLRLRSP